ncbi:MAG: 3-methyl-2-oxobutanoate hydroxymethyltransferase [Planctomycetota bacterium]|nr:3-methyl-2-oxobutanoate hydroxymethyltransferase [Planctomycetota bacterium]MDI6787469.1 3-methyl-2-oxobutanoate hydroxymethyltransferase [Planctomycetota bacterium]
MNEQKRITIPYLYELKKKGEPISWLTAYDFPIASLVDQSGIEMILVGDSASMVVYGNSSTLPITMDMMIEHCRAVRRGAPNAFVIGDMPFLSYQVSIESAVYNAGRFMKEGGCDGIKLEGGARVAETVRAIVNAGIPVAGHIGLTPQSSAMLGGFKVQGKDVHSAISLIEDAKALENVGAFGVLLECVPTKVSSIIRKNSNILVFGIGAGDDVDGQLLIIHDILGLYQCFTPKFVRQYVNLSSIIADALSKYRSEVKTRQFPAREHSFTIPAEELKKVEEYLALKKLVPAKAGNEA